MTFYRRLYGHACVLSAVAGGGYGTYKGTEAAIYNYSTRDLSSFELLCENFCGCLIIAGYSFLWSMIGFSTFVMLPVIAPVYGYKEARKYIADMEPQEIENRC